MMRTMRVNSELPGQRAPRVSAFFSQILGFLPPQPRRFLIGRRPRSL